ncbi:MAG: DUF5335 domain-containing protein [Patescibacteria group bacterium]|nr:DUF5335 domain-containing protein [Patescibacteria group bacterium]
MLKEIKKEDWKKFLADFSAMNQAKVIDLVYEDKELGSHVVAKYQPLLGIEPDLKDENFPTVDVTVGEVNDTEPATITHSVIRPEHIYLKQTDDGVLVGLVLEGMDGRTLLDFAAAGKTEGMIVNME